MNAVRSHASLLTRRQFLAAGVGLALAPLAGTTKAGASSAYRLKAFPSKHRIRPAPAQETAVWSDAGRVPGPVIRARQGVRLHIDFENGLEEPTTVLWHGLRIANDEKAEGDHTGRDILCGFHPLFLLDLTLQREICRVYLLGADPG